MKTPNFSDNEKQFFKEILSNHKDYLEYGAGESTLIAKEICNVTSIETDIEWAKKTGAIHVDIGKTASWGYPVNPPTIKQLSDYLSYAKGYTYDIMLIDGRFRVAVAYFAKDCEFMIHDYNRKEYHIIETFAHKLHQVETLALFKKINHKRVHIFSPL